MRLVDEITERPATRALSAPSGSSKTGPVPTTVPGLSIPEPTTAAPFLPTLPTSTPKAVESATSPAATNAAALFFQTANVVPLAAHAPRPKRRRRALIALAVIVAITLASAFAFRSSGLVERFTGKGYDTNPLPLHAIPRPPFSGAEYTLTSQ